MGKSSTLHERVSIITAICCSEQFSAVATLFSRLAKRPDAKPKMFRAALTASRLGTSGVTKNTRSSANKDALVPFSPGTCSRSPLWSTHRKRWLSVSITSTNNMGESGSPNVVPLHGRFFSLDGHSAVL